jgi:ubiquinone/menaquinone biosynthesis C-methylase UbiE
MWGFDTRRFYAELQRLGQLPAGSAILDVPCGGGVAFRGIRPEQDVRYVAADLNPTMRARADREAERRGLNQVEVVEGDVFDLQFEDGTFDLCLTYNGLHCFPDPARALVEMARVVKPGGTLRGSSATTGAGARQVALIRTYKRANIFGVTESPEDLRSWIESAGFADVTMSTSGAIASFEAVKA